MLNVASQRAPPHPVVNVDVGAHSVTPSAHATCAGAYGDDDDDDCFYYHSWRNNVVIAFGTLSSFLT